MSRSGGLSPAYMLRSSRTELLRQLRAASKLDLLNSLSIHNQISSNAFEQHTLRAKPRLNELAVLLSNGKIDQIMQRGKIGLDDFVMISVIGKGAYGKVVLAKLKSTKQLMAMKIIKKKSLQRNTKENLALLEKDVLTRVSHPFLVKLNYTFQTAQKLYFVLEYCPGGQLFNLISNNDGLSQDHAKFYAAQILLALDHMHKHNIVYRDLKPQNVLLGKDGYLKIADFGLCKRNFLTPQVFSITGTPQYIAPQNLQRKPCNFTIDWWALGSLIFQIIEGLPPFYSENREQIFMKIKKEEVKISAKVSESCKDLITKLLQKNPQRRLGAGGVREIMSHPWFAKVDFEAMMRKKYTAPYVPGLKSDLDLGHFSEEFTQEIIQSYSQSIHKETKNYDNFSYEAK